MKERVKHAAARRDPQGPVHAGERRRPPEVVDARRRTARAGPSTTPSSTRIRARSTPPPRASGTARRSGAAPTSARRGRSRAKGSRTRTAARCPRSRALSAAHGRVLVGVEAPGIFESRDDGATWSPYSMLEGQPGSEGWDDPANQPPGHLGISAITSDENDPDARLGDRAGHQPVRDDRRRQDVDAAQPRAARRLAARARGGRLLRPQGRPVAHRRAADVPAEPCRHASLGRCRRDVDGDHRRAADRVRVRRGGSSARPRHVPRDPARPGPRPHDAGRSSSGLADEGRGLELGAPRERPAAGERAPRRLAPRQ